MYFFNVKAKVIPLAYFLLFALIPNVSLLGHLCGVLMGYAYLFGLFRPFALSSSLLDRIDNSRLVQRIAASVGGFVPSGASSTFALPIVAPPADSSSSSTSSTEGVGVGGNKSEYHAGVDTASDVVVSNVVPFSGRGFRLGKD